MRVAGLLLVAACGSRPAHPTPKPIACKDRVARLERRLAELSVAEPGFMPHVRGLRTIDSAQPGQTFDARGQVVVITRDGSIVATGNWLDTAQAGRDHVAALEKRGLEEAATEQGPPPPWPLYIWPDRDAPIGVIADLVTGVSEHWMPRLLVGGGVAQVGSDRELLDMPSVRQAAAKLPGIEPDATTYVAHQIRDALGGCTAVVEVFVESGKSEGRAAEVLASRIPPALRACDCNVRDADVFEWGMLATFGAYEPPLRWVPVPKLSRRDRRTISQLVK